MESFFKLKENGTTVRTEILAGITTFMTMAYILIVNPLTLEAAGMDFGGVFTATALASIIATITMGLVANYPFALAPGMGLNAFFAYTVVLQMGYTWQTALTAVLIEGLIFIGLTFLNVREAIINSIPANIKKAISVGIGLFIAFIGLSNAGVVVNGATPLALGDLSSPTVIVAIVGLIVTSILLAMNVKGALLFGILLSALVGIPLGVTPVPESMISAPPSLAKVAFKFDFGFLSDPKALFDIVVVLFTFLMVDMFDTVGTLVGVATKADMLDEDGKLPRAKQALFADAIGTTIGACLGTSTVTTYVESASGVSEGGRTGLTALSTAGMFAIALFMSPLFIAIPGAATAPALILVGLFMMSPIQEIDLNDYTEAIPAFLTIIMMPLAYSIAEGIEFGILSYVLLKTFTGKAKDVPVLTYIVGLLFLVKIYLAYFA
ncbi:NCS2 family permease [Gottschalkiaceae bacterium SANA]|nr:NCS2 family permease [Gottschalkiaceae bacterium SANA]